MRGKNDVLRMAGRIIEAGKSVATHVSAQAQLEDIRLNTDYSEPGYSAPESGVIAFGNWNGVSRYNDQTHTFDNLDNTPARVADVLTKLGVELEWSDEWTDCCQCGNAVRTQPDSYSWSRSYWDSDDGAICADCVKSDPEEYITSLEGNTRSCVTFDLDVGEHGYVKLEGGFENGFHRGQDADPKVIGASLRAMGVERFLFVLDGVGQFDLNFSVWVHRDELERVKDWDKAAKDGPSVSGNLEKSLREAALVMSKASPEGIQVAQCHRDGTVTVKTITPQEFVDGKAVQ